MKKVNEIIKSILLEWIAQISGKQWRVISKAERSMVSGRLLLAELLNLVQGMFL